MREVRELANLGKHTHIHTHSWRAHCPGAPLGTGNIPVLEEIEGQGPRQPVEGQREQILGLAKPEPDPFTASVLAGFQTCPSLILPLGKSPDWF